MKAFAIYSTSIHQFVTGENGQLLIFTSLESAMDHRMSGEEIVEVDLKREKYVKRS